MHFDVFATGLSQDARCFASSGFFLDNEAQIKMNAFYIEAEVVDVLAQWAISRKQLVTQVKSSQNTDSVT